PIAFTHSAPKKFNQYSPGSALEILTPIAATPPPSREMFFASNSFVASAWPYHTGSLEHNSSKRSSANTAAARPSTRFPRSWKQRSYPQPQMSPVGRNLRSSTPRTIVIELLLPRNSTVPCTPVNLGGPKRLASSL